MSTNITITLIEIYIWFSVFFLSILIVLLAKMGIFGLTFKNYFYHKTVSEMFVLSILVGGMLMFVLQLLFFFVNFLLIDFNSKVLQVLPENTQDSVRWWPSGIPQTWAIIGAALAVYRFIPGSPRVKATAAFGTLGISAPATVYFHAVENQNGFNRLMFSWMKYKQTGSWPANIPDNISESDLYPIKQGLITETTENLNPTVNSFLPTDHFISSLIPDNIFTFFLQIIRPVPVEGFLDDLIGQQLFIHMLLLSVVIGLILIFSVFIFILIMVNNKDFISKQFKNKFILFFIKYQVFLSKISLIILPLFIFFGLLELFIGIYFLLTHPIPFDKLPVDLHIYIFK